MRNWWRRVRPDVIGGLVARLVSWIGATLRIETENWDAIEAIQAGKIICGWHGRSFVAAAKWRKRGYWVMISHSRDGEIQNQVFQHLGFQVIRGSTGRGGVRAAIEAIKVLRTGATMAMTPDGPRGPSGVLQEGVILMALKSGAALVPVGISARPCFHAKSWDRYLIPAPFSRAIMIFGEPMYVRPDADAEETEAVRRAFEAEITRLEALADDRIGNKK